MQSFTTDMVQLSHSPFIKVNDHRCTSISIICETVVSEYALPIKVCAYYTQNAGLKVTI